VHRVDFITVYIYSIHMETLGSLIKCFELYAVCEECQRVVGVDLHKLMRAEGADYPIDRVRMRLYCEKCQSRSQALRIVYVGPARRVAGFWYNRSR